MTYVDIPGSWLAQAIRDSKPKDESWARYLARCTKKLARVAGIDRTIIKKILAGDPDSPRIPLFALAVLGAELQKSVEFLLLGSDEVCDPNEITPFEDAEIRSATNFGRFLRTFDVAFPPMLWQYAFPAQRRGDVGEITLEGWIALHREHSGGQEPPRRSI